MAPTVTAIHLSDVKKDLILLPVIDINLVCSSDNMFSFSTSTFPTKHGLGELDSDSFSNAKRFKKDTSTNQNSIGLGLELGTFSQETTISSSTSPSSLVSTHELNTSVVNSPSNDFEFDIDSIISCPASPFQVSDEPLFSEQETSCLTTILKEEVVEKKEEHEQEEEEKEKEKDIKKQQLEDETSIFLELNNVNDSVASYPTSPEDEILSELEGKEPKQLSTSDIEKFFHNEKSFDSLSPQAVRLLCILDLENGEKLSQTPDNSKSSEKEVTTTTTSSNQKTNESHSDIYIRTIPYLVDSYGESILETLDSNGFSIVHYSAMEGLIDVFQFLEKKGYSKYINVLDSRGYSVLYISVLFKKFETISYLLEKGFNASQTILRVACELGDIKILTLLLSKSKAIINEQDNQGKTLLHCAVSLGRKDLVELLIKHGASPSKKDCCGTTSLITAVMLGYHDFLNLLIKDKSTIHLTDLQGKTALHWAASVGNIPAADYLISQGAKLETRDKKGRTPFLLASFSQQTQMIRFLRDKNANKDVKDNEGREASNLASIL